MRKHKLIGIIVLFSLTSHTSFAAVQYLCDDQNGTNCQVAPASAVNAQPGDVVGVGAHGKLDFLKPTRSGCTLGSLHAFPAQGFVTDDFVVADGRTVVAEDYPEFVKAWTGDDSATQVTVLDMRGEFVRGVDLGRGVDNNRQVGTAQVDEHKSHHHSLLSVTTYDGYATGFGYTTNVKGVSGVHYGNNPSYFERDAQNTGNQLVSDTGGAETRPRNVAHVYAYCAK